MDFKVVNKFIPVYVMKNKNSLYSMYGVMFRNSRVKLTKTFEDIQDLMAHDNIP